MDDRCDFDEYDVAGYQPEFLTRMIDGIAVGGVEVGVKDGEFEYGFQ